MKEENSRYVGGLTRRSINPIARTMMLRKPKKALNAPSAVVLVAVKYRSMLPMMSSIKPKNFSVRLIQNVSPSSLMLCLSFFCRVAFTITHERLF